MCIMHERMLLKHRGVCDSLLQNLATTQVSFCVVYNNSYIYAKQSCCKQGRVLKFTKFGEIVKVPDIN